MNPLRALPRTLSRLVRRVPGLGGSAAERAASDAKSSARKYWRRRVAEETRHDAPKGGSSREETAARESAKKYWEREVADERERRGTPDPPGKR